MTDTEPLAGCPSPERIHVERRWGYEVEFAVGSESVAWHAKTLNLLKRLYARLEVRLVG